MSCSIKDMHKWEALWSASKYLDSGKIRRFLLDQNTNTNTSRNSNGNTRTDSSLLGHTPATLQLLKYLFEDVACMDETEDTNLDNDDSSELSHAEKKVLGLRSMLLLPANSVAPWDTLKSYLRLMQLSCQIGTETASSLDITSRKSIGDVRIFISSIFKGDGSDDDLRTIHAQRKEILSLCKILVKFIHNADDCVGMRRVETFQFQLIVPLFKATLRSDSCLQKKTRKSKRQVHREGSILSLSSHFLDSLLSIRESSMKSDCIIPKKLESLLIVAKDLDKKFSTEHWSHLQNLIVRSVRKYGSSEGNITTSSAKGIIGSIFSLMGYHQGFDEATNTQIIIRWTEIIMYIYHIISSSHHHCEGQDLDLSICNDLANLSDVVWEDFLSAVVGRKRSSSITSTDSISVKLSEIRVPYEVRANMHLFAFNSRRGITTVRNYAANILPSNDPNVEIGKEDLIISSMLSLTGCMAISENFEDDEDREASVSLTAGPMEALRLVIDRNEIIQESKLHYAGHKMSSWKQTFEQCFRLLKSNSYARRRGHSSQQRFVSHHKILMWKRFAHRCVQTTIKSLDIGRAVMAGAIFLGLFDDHLSSSENIVQDIVENLCIYGHSEEEVSICLFYCWILHTLTSQPCENRIDKKIAEPGIFSSIYQLMETYGMVLPRIVRVELMRSIIHLPTGRKKISTYCLREIEQGSLNNQGSQRVQFGLDGILLLLEDMPVASEKFDDGVLIAFRFVSDEVARKQPIMSNEGWLGLLARLLGACKNSKLYRAALDRIAAAALISILPHFRCRCISSNDILFHPYNSLCVETEEATDPQEGFLLTIRLILLLIQNQSAHQKSTYSDGILWTIFKEVFSEDDVEGPDETYKSAKFEAVPYIKALVRSFSKLDPHHVERFGREAGDQPLSEDRYDAICREEVKFWARAADDVTNVASPKWILHVRTDVSTMGPTTEERQQLSQPMCSVLSSLFLSKILSKIRSDIETTSINIESDIRPYVFMLSAVNSILHFLWTSRVNVETSWMLFDSGQADEEYFIIADFFFSNSIILRMNALDTHSHQLSSMLPATLEICSRLDALLLSSDKTKCINIGTIFAPLAEFYCTCCYRKDDTTVTVASTVASTTMNGANYDAKKHQELRIAILHSLRKFLKSAHSNKASFITGRKEINTHFQLLQQICKDINIELKINSNESKYCRMYTKIISELVDLLVEVFRRNQIIDPGDNSDEVLASSSHLLWDTLRRYDPKSKLIYKSLMSVVIKMSELVRLVNFWYSLAPISSVCERITTNNDGLKECSLSTIAFDLFAKDLVHKLSATPPDTFKYSWLWKDDYLQNSWILDLFLDNFGNMRIESTRIISAIATNSLEKVWLNGQHAERYAKMILIDLRSTLSSGILLLSTCFEPMLLSKMPNLCNYIEKVVITLSNAVCSISRHYRNAGQSLKTTCSNLADFATLEAFVFLIAWLQVSPSDDATSHINIDFVSVSKVWYGKRKDFKGLTNQSSKVLSRIEDLNSSLIKLSKQMKKSSSIGNDKFVDSILSTILLKDELEGFNLTKMIDTYLSTRGGSHRIVAKKSAVNPTASSSEKNDKGVKMRMSRKRNRKKRYRNSLVNEWLDLDQEIDDTNDKYGYHDLEDFILPG